MSIENHMDTKLRARVYRERTQQVPSNIKQQNILRIHSHTHTGISCVDNSGRCYLKACNHHTNGKIIYHFVVRMRSISLK